MDTHGNDKSQSEAVPPIAIAKPATTATTAAHGAEARAAHTPREDVPPSAGAAEGVEGDDKKEPERAALIALRFNKKSAIWNFRDEETAPQPASAASVTATPTAGGRQGGGGKGTSTAQSRTRATPKAAQETAAGARGSAASSATRPSAETLAEMLRAHREMQSAAGPVQSTTVVKKEKKKERDSATRTPSKKTPKTDASANKDGEGAAKAGDAPSATAEAPPPTVQTGEKVKEDVKKTPKTPANTATHVAVVRKKSKAKTPTPPATVMTVKADKSVEELRALRTRGAGGAANGAHGHQAAEKTESALSVVDEITDLLLQYCRGEDRATGGTHAPANVDTTPATVTSTAAAQDAAEGTEATAHVNGEKKEAAAEAPVGSTAEAEAAAQTDSAHLGASAEVALYEKLVHLCQREEVTPATLELIRELVQHTRVIPQASRENAYTETAVISRRREYVQQIILVLLNQLKQQKMAEEAYTHQYQPYMPSLRSSPAAPSSYLASPMAPMVDHSAALIAAATNRMTLFNPQFSAPIVQTSAVDATPTATPNHALRATAAPFVPATQRSGTVAAAAPMIPSMTPSSAGVSHTSSPFRGGLSADHVPAIAPSPFPGAFPIVMGSAATPSQPPMGAFAAPVTLSDAERDVLRTVQQSFQQSVAKGSQAESGGGVAAPPTAQHTAVGKRKAHAEPNGTTVTDSTTATRGDAPSPSVASGPGSTTATASSSSTMNVNAPAFVPGAGAAVPSFTPPVQATGSEPWASNATFAEYKKMMDTFTQAQALMRKVKQQQQMLATAGKKSELQEKS